MNDAVRNVEVVKAFLDAWNRHDVAALADAVTEDLAWYMIDGDTMSAELRGREPLRAWLTETFAKSPSMHSEGEGFISSGRIVTYRETAITPKSRQASIAVYEVENGKIRRGWYFPMG